SWTLSDDGTRTAMVSVFSSFRFSNPMTLSLPAVCLQFVNRNAVISPALPLNSSALVGTRKCQVLGHHHVELVARPDFQSRHGAHPLLDRALAHRTKL